MARFTPIFGLLALCLLVSACEKAKMRTVAPANPNASASADPGYPPPQEDYQPADLTPPPYEEPVVTSTPPPAPPRPVTRLDDYDDYQYRDEVPAKEVRRPAPRDCCRPKVVVEDCPPGQVIVRPRPRPEVRPRPRPRRPIREEIVVEERIVREHLELGAAADLHCRWEPTGTALTYLRYDPIKKIAWVKHGWPQKWSQYTNVRLVSGLPPYMDKGLTLVTSKNIPIASLLATGNGRIHYEQGTTYPYEATFGEVPGKPKRNVKGVCWSKDEPAKQDHR